MWVDILKTTSLILVLFIFWLLLSGIYYPFFIISGFVISVLIVIFIKKLKLLDNEGHPIEYTLKAVFIYWPWLLKEIFFSALAVSKIILSKNMQISPTLSKIKSTQQTDFGKTVFANSITLTPGTLSVEISNDKIEVHALTKSGIEELKVGKMDRKVTKFEK